MSYKIALTSSDGESIDLHFGKTSAFTIVEVDERDGTWQLLETRTLAAGPSCGPASGCGGGHERLAAALTLLAGCEYILTAKIGPKPQAFFRRAGITALEAPPSLAAAIPPLNAYRLKRSG
ncbi:MAG: dinitrogenase iron-molybdenum cofactor biosynthesis protein [Treponema sp.]|nr:dinitrogenase iron-molybdenum cofactor biosynthesis protein [Treponema sp.]